jgi:hypothetical protein
MLQFVMSRYVLLLWGWRKYCRAVSVVSVKEEPQSSFCCVREGRTAEHFFLHAHNNRMCRDTPNYNIQHKNALENETIEVRNMLSYWKLWIKLIIKYCVSCWITDILQNYTLSMQYQTLKYLISFSKIKTVKTLCVSIALASPTILDLS